MELKIKPKYIFIFFVLLSLLFAALHMVLYHYTYFVDREYHAYYKWFNMGSEESFPTFAIIFQWFLCLVLLLVIAMIHKATDGSYFFWIFLFLIFLFLSLDESLSLHEKLVDSSRKSSPRELSFVYLSWIIPYLAGTIVFFLLSIRFLLKINKRTRYLFIISGIVFLIGAVGLELVENYYYYGFLTRKFIKRIEFQLSVVAGESFEMFGLAIFIYSLLDYIKIKSKGVLSVRLY